MIHGTLDGILQDYLGQLCRVHLSAMSVQSHHVPIRSFLVSFLNSSLHISPSQPSLLFLSLNLVVSLQLIDERAFQISTFKLRNQEYKYYLEQHKAEMPAIPDLSDNSGGLSNPAYYNFASYIQWKSAARAVLADGDRARLHQAVGLRLADALAPEALAFAKEAASRGDYWVQEGFGPFGSKEKCCKDYRFPAKAACMTKGKCSRWHEISILPITYRRSELN